MVNQTDRCNTVNGERRLLVIPAIKNVVAFIRALEGTICIIKLTTGVWHLNVCGKANRVGFDPCVAWRREPEFNGHNDPHDHHHNHPLKLDPFEEAEQRKILEQELDERMRASSIKQAWADVDDDDHDFGLANPSSNENMIQQASEKDGASVIINDTNSGGRDPMRIEGSSWDVSESSAASVSSSTQVCESVREEEQKCLSVHIRNGSPGNTKYEANKHLDEAIESYLNSTANREEADKGRWGSRFDFLKDPNSVHNRRREEHDVHRESATPNWRQQNHQGQVMRKEMVTTYITVRLRPQDEPKVVPIKLPKRT